MKMPAREIENVMFAPCGMNCMICYKHCYHKHSCDGCLKSDLGKPEHCRKCRIKNCIVAKGYSFCYECTEYPCRQIKTLDKSYLKNYGTSLFENSNFVKSHGLTKFMALQKEKFTCSNCGGIISLHDMECSECRLKQ